MPRSTSGRHVFISYVREDAAEVDRIQRILEAAGARVWRDTADLWPGEDWRMKIRLAITSDSLVFVACFSDHSANRQTTYQNEELLLAVDQLRLRHPDQPWLIPVRLSDCALPQYDLGAGRTLDSLQRVDLFGDRWDEGTARLVAGVLRVLAVLEGQPGSAVASPEAGPAVFVKGALLDPSRQIELEDYVMTRATEAALACSDEQVFPASSAELTEGIKGIRFLASQANRYWAAVAPLMAALMPGCTWGQVHHNGIWTRAIERVSNTAKPGSGQTALIELRRYPILPLLYSAALAALHRRNFSSLKAVSVDPQFRTDQGPIPLVGAAHVWRPFSQVGITAQVLALEADGQDVGDDTVEALRTGRKGNRHTPVSDHLHTRLRPLFQDLIPDEQDYTATFDRMEVLLGGLAADLELTTAGSGPYVDGAWFGSFTWRDRYGKPTLEQRMLDEIRNLGEEWPPLAAGLFGGRAERAEAAFVDFVADASKARQQRW